MDHIAQIKARLPIADVVGTYVRLERAGSNFRALCPFHKERSPSFNVSPARDAFYCFGCAKGGDIFTFVQEIEGISFPEALKLLAARAGVQLPERSSALLDQQKSAKERLIELMEVSTKLFEAHLVEHPEVREYLHGRGLTDETIAKFRIGFAPLEWRALHEALRSKGFSDSEIERSRVVKKVEGRGYYDTFRGRIMFPIMDPSGRVIAFTGRVWGDQKAPDGTPVAKYLNSPEGELYEKSRVLFAYDRAKVPMRKADVAILVEGQMDCIMAHQAGSENTIAISGTALTKQQVELIKRLTKHVIILLDADSAGINASYRSALIALGEEMDVRAAMVPGGKDPADYILEHQAEWPAVLENAKDIVLYYIDALRKLRLTRDENQERVERNIFPLIAIMQSSMKRARYISEIARLLEIPEDSAWKDIERFRSKNEPFSEQREREVEPPVSPPSMNAVSTLVRVSDELIGLLLWQEIHKESTLAHEEIRARHAQLYKELEIDFVEPGEADAARLLITAESRYGKDAKLQEIAEELLDRVERELLKEKQESLFREISRAESAKEDTSEYMAQYRALAPRIIAVEDRMRQRAHLM